MQRTSVSPSCVQDLFNSATNAAQKGQAQWYTPRAWAQLLTKPLPLRRPTIVDLTCGRGDLAIGCANTSTLHRLGCDIDGTDHRLAEGNFIRADLTTLLPLLNEVDFRADMFTLNPPWDLHWHRDRLALLGQSRVPAVRATFKGIDPRLGRYTIDRTVATLAIALDCCSDVGEGFVIANAATVERLILDDDAPHVALRDHVWAVITVDGNICSTAKPRPDAEPFRTAILYFALSHISGPKVRLHIKPPEGDETFVTAAARELDRVDRWLREGSEIRDYLRSDQTAILWQAVRGEWNERQAARPVPRYNLSLSHDGLILSNLSLFEHHSTRIDKVAAKALHDLNGKRPMQLVMQREQRDALQEAIGEASPWSVDPKLAAAVAQAIADYHAQRAPLYPLPEIQRLGYLDEEDEIVCKADWSPRLVGQSTKFKAGRAYAIRTHTVTVRRKSERVGLSGEMEDIEYTGAELCILITDDLGREWSFMEQRLRSDKVSIIGMKRNLREDLEEELPEGKQRVRALRDADGQLGKECIDFTLQELVKHFIIPTVPDVAAVNPEGYQRNLNELQAIEVLCG